MQIQIKIKNLLSLGIWVKHNKSKKVNNQILLYFQVFKVVTKSRNLKFKLKTPNKIKAHQVVIKAKSTQIRANSKLIKVNFKVNSKM